jgi:hypothetical protein
MQLVIGKFLFMTVCCQHIPKNFCSHHFSQVPSHIPLYLQTMPWLGQAMVRMVALSLNFKQGASNKVDNLLEFTTIATWSLCNFL